MVKVLTVLVKKAISKHIFQNFFSDYLC